MSCLAIGCGYPTPDHRAFCYRHWALAPRQHKDAVRDAQATGKPAHEQLAVESILCAIAVREGALPAKEAEQRLNAKREELRTTMAQEAAAEYAYFNRLRQAQTTTVVPLDEDDTNIIRVTRGTKYGNPFAVVGTSSNFPVIFVATKEEAVAKFREWLTTSLVVPGWEKLTPWDVHMLRGRRIACSCREPPCHALVLAELANRGAVDVYDEEVPF